MYRGFQIKISKEHWGTANNFIQYVQKGEDLLRPYDNKVTSSISKVVDENGEINGTKLQENWFPSDLKFDVFLSHSHTDEMVAKAIAGYLYERLGIVTFIDSLIWENYKELINGINVVTASGMNKKITVSETHANLMLNTALMQMMDRTECLLFLNTPNSVNIKSIGSTTYSPWIYSELSMSRMLYPRRSRIRMFANESTDDNVYFKIHDDHLVNLSMQALFDWGRCGLYKTEALDWLYKSHHYLV